MEWLQEKGVVNSSSQELIHFNLLQTYTNEIYVMYGPPARIHAYQMGSLHYQSQEIQMTKTLVVMLDDRDKNAN